MQDFGTRTRRRSCTQSDMRYWTIVFVRLAMHLLQMEVTLIFLFSHPPVPPSRSIHRASKRRQTNRTAGEATPSAGPIQESAGKSHTRLFVAATLSSGTPGPPTPPHPPVNLSWAKRRNAKTTQRSRHSSSASPDNPCRSNAGQGIQRCRYPPTPLQVHVECSPTGATCCRTLGPRPCSATGSSCCYCCFFAANRSKCSRR